MRPASDHLDDSPACVQPASERTLIAFAPLVVDIAMSNSRFGRARSPLTNCTGRIRRARSFAWSSHACEDRQGFIACNDPFQSDELLDTLAASQHSKQFYIVPSAFDDRMQWPCRLLQGRHQGGLQLNARSLGREEVESSPSALRPLPSVKTSQ